jgi:hypothetical protein
VYISGRWTGLDLVASPRLFASAWPRISAGYVAEAIGRRKRAKAIPAAGSILNAVRRAAVEEAPAVGLGRELRFVTRTLHGAALMAGGHIAHLTAFPMTPLRRREWGE